MAELEVLPTPHLTPETVKVFLADDSATKRELVTASLGEYGLAHSIIVATTFEQGEEFMRNQQPGSLDANVFLLDGSLESHSLQSRTWQGNRLAHDLFHRYGAPYAEIITNATSSLKAAGLSAAEAVELIDYDKLYSIITRKMLSEALIVGISISDEGAISGDIAQVPRTDYGTVGKTVYEMVIPKKLRRQLEGQKHRQENEARKQAALATAMESEPTDRP